jgi:hypothetical protein
LTKTKTFTLYDDGVFTGLSGIDVAGNSAIGRVQDGTEFDGMDFGDRLFLSPGSIKYRSTDYALVSSEFTVLAPVPLPASLPLLALAIATLRLSRR